MSCFFLWITINYFILTSGNSSIDPRTIHSLRKVPFERLYVTKTWEYTLHLVLFRNEDIVKVHISLY